MTPLLQLQRCMARAITQPISNRGTLRRKNVSGENNVVLAESIIKPNSRLASFERLEIYHRSYWFRILDSFAEDFSGVRAILGAARFDSLRRAYLADCPSRSFTLRNLGVGLVHWMQSHPEFLGNHAAMVIDMARLEWAEIEAFDEAEYPALSADAVALLGPDDTLSLQPHLRLLRLRHAVDRLLLEVRERTAKHRDSPYTFRTAKMERANRPDRLYLVIHRTENFVHHKRLDREMFRLLSALGRGDSIGTAIEHAYAGCTLSPEACATHIRNSSALFARLGWLHATRQKEVSR